MVKYLIRNDKVSKPDILFHSSAYACHDYPTRPPVVNGSCGHHSSRDRAHFRWFNSCDAQRTFTTLKDSNAIMNAVTHHCLETYPKALLHRFMFFRNSRNQYNISAIN